MEAFPRLCLAATRSGARDIPVCEREVGIEFERTIAIGDDLRGRAGTETNDGTINVRHRQARLPRAASSWAALSGACWSKASIS